MGESAFVPQLCYLRSGSKVFSRGSKEVGDMGPV
jgi:hypothetical protein